MSRRKRGFTTEDEIKRNRETKMAKASTEKEDGKPMDTKTSWQKEEAEAKNEGERKPQRGKVHSPSEGEEEREQIKDEMPRQKEKVKSMNRDGTDPKEEATSRGRSRNRRDRRRKSLTEQAKEESSSESKTSRSRANRKKAKYEITTAKENVQRNRQADSEGESLEAIRGKNDKRHEESSGGKGTGNEPEERCSKRSSNPTWECKRKRVKREQGRRRAKQNGQRKRRAVKDEGERRNKPQRRRRNKRKGHRERERSGTGSKGGESRSHCKPQQLE